MAKKNIVMKPVRQRRLTILGKRVKSWRISLLLQDVLWVDNDENRILQEELFIINTITYCKVEEHMFKSKCLLVR